MIQQVYTVCSAHHEVYQLHISLKSLPPSSFCTPAGHARTSGGPWAYIVGVSKVLHCLWAPFGYTANYSAAPSGMLGVWEVCGLSPVQPSSSAQGLFISQRNDRNLLLPRLYLEKGMGPFRFQFPSLSRVSVVLRWQLSSPIPRPPFTEHLGAGPGRWDTFEVLNPLASF